MSIQALNLRYNSGIQKQIFSESQVASDAKADFEHKNRNKFRKSNETNGESSIKLLQIRQEEQLTKIPILDFHQTKYQTDLNQKIAKCKHSKILEITRHKIKPENKCIYDSLPTYFEKEKRLHHLFQTKEARHQSTIDYFEKNNSSGKLIPSVGATKISDSSFLLVGNPVPSEKTSSYPISSLLSKNNQTEARGGEGEEEGGGEEEGEGEEGEGEGAAHEKLNLLLIPKPIQAPRTLYMEHYIRQKSTATNVEKQIKAHQYGNLKDPSQGTQDPSQGTQVPSQGNQIPSQGKQVPSQGNQIPSQGTQVPSQGIQVPSSGISSPSVGAATKSRKYLEL